MTNIETIQVNDPEVVCYSVTKLDKYYLSLFKSYKIGGIRVYLFLSTTHDNSDSELALRYVYHTFTEQVNRLMAIADEEDLFNTILEVNLKYRGLKKKIPVSLVLVIIKGSNVSIRTTGGSKSFYSDGSNVKSTSSNNLYLGDATRIIELTNLSYQAKKDDHLIILSDNFIKDGIIEATVSPYLLNKEQCANFIETHKKTDNYYAIAVIKI